MADENPGISRALGARERQLIDPTAAHHRVRFYDAADPNRSMAALFNPEELPEDTEVTIGELNPIGSSHTTLQYAHTKSPTYTLSLPYTQRGVSERASPIVNLKEALRFYRSFCFAPRKGFAPSILTMVWPDTLTVNMAVRRVGVRYTRWTADMELYSYSIDLDCIEKRRTFLSSGDVLSGVSASHPDPVGSHAPTSGQNLEDAGRPLRVVGSLKQDSV